MIRFECVTKSFSGQTLFNNMSLNISLNKTTAIAGPSGSGKTTLLRLIAGLDKDFKGTITGVPERISFMFQEDRLLPWKDVKGNIEFVLKGNMEKTAMDAAVNQIIEEVRLSGHENKTPSSLSGGMKRRVALARAFCYPSDLLILDEPFNGLDAQLKKDMADLFDRLFIRAGKSAIIVTHDAEVIKGLSCEVIDIKKI
jgi:NitT/TauT family transport system ATP-binding protein